MTPKLPSARRAISCARDDEIRIHVRSSFTRAEGSVVGPDGDQELAVKSITSDGKFVVVKIQGTAMPDPIFSANLQRAAFRPSIMQWLRHHENNGSLRLAFKRQDSFEAIPFCWEEAARLSAEEVICHANVQTISLIGCGIGKVGHVVFLNALEKIDIVPVLWHQDKIRMSIAVEKEKAQPCIAALHDVLLDSVKTSS